jgi:hypothetical protein
MQKVGGQKLLIPQVHSQSQAKHKCLFARNQKSRTRRASEKVPYKFPTYIGIITPFRAPSRKQKNLENAKNVQK